MNLNSVSLIGRVTKDPEARKLPSGNSVTSIGIATNRTWKDKEGVKKEEVEFHNVIAFSKLADIIAQYVKKGQLIYIQGRLQTRSWEAEGVKKYKTEIVADQMQMGPKSANSADTGRQSAPKEEGIDYPAEEINADDIPF